jgi:hypothetical protein
LRTYFPAGQVAQFAAPEEENEPASQSAQSRWQEAQLVQVGLCVPAAQVEQLVCPVDVLSVPAAQMSHSALPAVSSNLPSSQTVHVVMPFSGYEYLPTEQVEQEGEPGCVVLSPGLQKEQATAGTALENEPMSQGVHVEAEEPEMLPGAQAEQAVSPLPL